MECFSSPLYCSNPHTKTTLQPKTKAKTKTKTKSLSLKVRPDENLSGAEFKNGIEGFEGNESTNKARQRGLSRPIGALQSPLLEHRHFRARRRLNFYESPFGAAYSSCSLLAVAGD